MTLITKYRPASLQEFIGNRAAVHTLEKALTSQSPPRSFMFSGQAGSGKTTLARILKQHFNCANMDSYELNASSDRGIDNIRAVITNSQYKTISGGYSVYFFDEAHQLTKDAQEALLKVVEEPPPKTVFIFCTSEPQALKESLKRRTLYIHLQPLSKEESITLIKNILNAEGISLKNFTKEIIDTLIEVSNASPGKIIANMEKIIYLRDVAQMKDVLLNVAAPEEEEFINICRILVDEKRSESQRWKDIQHILKGLQFDAEVGRKIVMSYLSKVLLNTSNPRIAWVMLRFKDNFFASGVPGFILACYYSCGKE